MDVWFPNQSKYNHQRGGGGQSPPFFKGIQLHCFYYLVFRPLTSLLLLFLPHVYSVIQMEVTA